MACWIAQAMADEVSRSTARQASPIVVGFRLANAFAQFSPSLIHQQTVRQDDQVHVPRLAVAVAELTISCPTTAQGRNASAHTPCDPVYSEREYSLPLAEPPKLQGMMFPLLHT